MQGKEVIRKIIEHGDCNKEVYIKIITRNGYGNDVIRKVKYPISNVFSYLDGECVIYIEEAEGVELT